MEPSRCKTTSTVTIACEHRPRPLPKHRGARESKTQYMTYSWRKGEEKRQNSNIQPYKIIRRTSVRPSLRYARCERDGGPCADRKDFFYSPFLFFIHVLLLLFFFGKLKQFLLRGGSLRGPARPCDPLSVLLSSAAATRATVDWLRLDRGWT